MLNKSEIIEGTIQQFALKYSKIGEMRLNDYETLIKSINTAYENGELIKKELKDITEAFGRIFDITRDRDIKGSMKHIAPVYREEMSPLHNALYDNPMSRAGLNKYVREINKCSTDGEDPEIIESKRKVLEYANELIAISEKINGLKDLVVSKKKDAVLKEQKIEQEKAAKASHRDVMMTVNHLKDLTSGKRDELVREFKGEYLSQVEKKIEKLNEGEMEIPKTRAREKEIGYSYKTVSIVLDRLKPVIIDNKTRKQVGNLKSPDEIEADAIKFGEQTADLLIDQYIYRIADKVSHIIKEKDNLESIKTRSFKATSAIVGVLNFKFKDGSEFSLNTQTVLSSNPVNPGYHIKVPTRFFDIKDDTGKMTRSMSEKEVQERLIP